MYHFLCRLAADLLLAGLGGPTPGGQQHCQLTDKSRAETVLATIDNYRVFANIFQDYNSILNPITSILLKNFIDVCGLF